VVLNKESKITKVKAHNQSKIDRSYNSHNWKNSFLGVSEVDDKGLRPRGVSYFRIA